MTSRADGKAGTGAGADALARYANIEVTDVVHDTPRRYDEAQVRADYRKLTLALIDRNLTITTMESATAGQLASLITDTEGSSAILKGAFVTYCNEAKVANGVPREVIDTYTVYSGQTAAAMAEACRRFYDADIGIGVTGTMGNVDPANPESSEPGQVWFALCLRVGAGVAATVAARAAEGAAGDGEADAATETHVFHLELLPQPTRLAYKLAVAQEVFEQLRALLQS